MKIVRSWSHIPNIRKPVVAIGIFDGVHKGHQALIKKTLDWAKVIGGTAVVLTFFPHPVHVLKKNVEMSLLVSLEHRLSLIENLEIPVCIVCRFTKKFAKISAKEFIIKYLVKNLGVNEIFVGENFHFGKKRQGRSNFLKRMALRYGFRANVIKSIKYHKTTISSSRLRRLIARGDIQIAQKFLGRHVSVLGRVSSGDGLGHTLGFPTANINPGKEILLPMGVYLSGVRIRNKIHPALAYIGTRPSVKGRPQVILEAHILNFSTNVYGRVIEVMFLKRLRVEKKFKTKQGLIRAMQADKIRAQEFFKTHKSLLHLP